MEVFRRDSFSHQRFQSKGVVPFKLGHVAFHVTDVKHVTKFYCDVLGFRESDWMRRPRFQRLRRAARPYYQARAP
jgi:catechol-2,3-dioxygenase